MGTLYKKKKRIEDKMKVVENEKKKVFPDGCLVPHGAWELSFHEKVYNDNLIEKGCIWPLSVSLRGKLT